MIKKNLSVLVCVISLLFIHMSVKADLFSGNDPTLPPSIDGANLTYDSSTGFEWLDLDLSEGRSFDDLAGVDGSNEFDVGGDYAGFQYAKRIQLTGQFNGPQQDSLYKSAGVAWQVFSSLGSYTDVRTLIQVAGCFGECQNYGYVSGNLLENDGITVAAASVQAFQFNGSDWGSGFPTGATTPREPNDSFPTHHGNWIYRIAVDTDGDAVVDSLDNCTLHSNPDQLDTNADGYGNRCDPDINNDGIVNFLDFSMWMPFFNTSNSGDVDFNGDGQVNFVDLAVIVEFFLMPPGPGNVSP